MNQLGSSRTENPKMVKRWMPRPNTGLFACMEGAGIAFGRIRVRLDRAVEVAPPRQVLGHGLLEALRAVDGHHLLPIDPDVHQLGPHADRLEHARVLLSWDLDVMEAAAVGDEHPPLA